MLSVTSIRSKKYYIKLSSEDYYLEGGEPPGKWHGKGAKALGLNGTIAPAQFEFVIDGFIPDGQKKIVQNAGAKKRQPGWDLTFSAPKTVSVVWSQTDEKTRQLIQNCQEQATRKALDWLESESTTRRGKGGLIKEPARLTIATFEHGTSRAQDPQLHTHCLVMNAAVRGDGSTGAIESKQFYQNKMIAGALYRAEFANQLEQRCGFAVKRSGEYQNLFEIRGVDPALVQEFSKRREEIEKALEESGHVSAKASEIAALNTRERKGHVARQELFKSWQEVGQAFSYKEPQRKTIQYSRIATAPALYKIALENLMRHNSSFTEKELLRKMAEAAPGTGISVDNIREFVENILNQKEIVCLGRDGEAVRYTTKAMYALERSLLKAVKESADRSKRRTAHQVEKGLIEHVCRQFPTLKLEQRAAVDHIVSEPGSIKVVEGWAGTGKTYMLNVARQAWEKAGYRVHGAALAAKAAGNLEESGIRSQTLHRLLYQVRDRRTFLTRRDVVVVDEAGMVGTRQFAELVAATEGAGAKLILVGDSQQLQPIEAGGAFQKIGDILGRAALQEITRQKISWMRASVRDMITGNTKQVLADYARHGQLNVADDWNDARQRLVADWGEAGGIQNPQHNLILAGSNLDVYDLNRQCQSLRQQTGILRENNLKINSSQLWENDRVLFTRNSTRDGVKNGQVGTVEAITGSRLSIRLDSGVQRTIDTNSYDHIKLGYAVTTHKAQGDTKRQSFVLVGGSMQDRELSYVQLSRSTGKTFLFTDRQEAGDNLAALSKEMARSRQKQMALTHI